MFDTEQDNNEEDTSFDKQKGYQQFLEKERQIQVNLNECMLCLVNISNCVLMECGHSSICFDCTMHLAINSRAKGKLPFCHLCRKVIKFALKIEVPDERLTLQHKLEFSPNDDSDDGKSGKKQSKVLKVREQHTQKFVRILSFVDMTEIKPRAIVNQRRRKFPKFKEKVISDDTRWVMDNSDFTGMMNEFKYQEKPPAYAGQPKP